MQRLARISTRYTHGSAPLCAAEPATATATEQPPQIVFPRLVHISSYRRFFRLQLSVHWGIDRVLLYEGGNVAGDGLVGVRVLESKEMWEQLAGRV